MFVLNKQVKQKFGSSLSNVFQDKKIKGGTILEKQLWKSFFFGKIVGCRPANLRKVNFFTDILQGFC